jgi:hypothetical protein
MKKLLFSLLGGLLILAPLLTKSVSAAGASIYLTPSSGNITQGSSFSVGVYEDSGASQANAVGVDLSYPANLVDFVSITQGSTFDFCPTLTGGSGSVSIECGSTTFPTGPKLVVTVNFKAKTTNGAVPIPVLPSSVLYNGANNLNPTLTGANFTIVSPPVPPSPPPPPPTPPPAPSPSPSPTPSPKPAPSPSPQSKTTTPTTLPSTNPPPPKVVNDGITISNISATVNTDGSATIKWTTSGPGDSTVEYGIATGVYPAHLQDSNMATEHSVQIGANVLSPGVTIHYIVKSADASGKNASSSDQQFTTPGLTVVFTVLTEKSKPAVGAKVTVGGKTVTTDRNGKATITDVSSGIQKAVVLYHGKKTIATATVSAVNLGTEPQNITLKAQSGNNYWPLALPALLLLVVGAFYLSRRSWGGLGDLSRHFAGAAPGPVAKAPDHPAMIINPGAGAPEDRRPPQAQLPGTIHDPSEPTVIEPSKPPDNK